MKNSVKLDIEFPAQALLRDVNSLKAEDWVPHFNTSYYTGEWSAVPLRSVQGSPRRIYPDITSNDFRNTEILGRCPAVKIVLDQFLCPLRTVRFMKLAAGSTIREHRDDYLGFEDGMVRFHIPVVTNPDVSFLLDGERIPMKEGECWYLNFNCLHSVENNGRNDRIHLAIDCFANDWIAEQLTRADQFAG